MLETFDTYKFLEISFPFVSKQKGETDCRSISSTLEANSHKLSESSDKWSAMLEKEQSPVDLPTLPSFSQKIKIVQMAFQGARTGVAEV